MSMHVPNQYRVRTGWHGTTDSIGNNGAFFVPNGAGRALLLRALGHLAVLALFALLGVLLAWRG